mgnify:CR=1 FL=1
MVKRLSNLFIFSLIFSSVLTPVYSEKLDKNITTKIDVQTFWKKVKETREIKYGKDEGWDKNMDYCSYWSENIALTKEEGLVMSKLIKYADKCMNTLNFMTRYTLDENSEYKE